MYHHPFGESCYSGIKLRDHNKNFLKENYKRTSDVGEDICSTYIAPTPEKISASVRDNLIITRQTIGQVLHKRRDPDDQ